MQIGSSARQALQPLPSPAPHIDNLPSSMTSNFKVLAKASHAFKISHPHFSGLTKIKNS